MPHRAEWKITANTKGRVGQNGTPQHTLTAKVSRTEECRICHAGHEEDNNDDATPDMRKTSTEMPCQV